MTTQLGKISYDIEWKPEGISTSRSLLRRYEHAMSMLGTKDTPYYAGECDHFFHVDGISAEMAPARPFTDSGEMFRSLLSAKEIYERTIGLYLRGQTWVNLDDINHFDADTVPWLVEQVSVFGCSPDYVKGRQRRVPTRVKASRLRELGMHLHLDLMPQYRDTRSKQERIDGAPPTNVESVAPIVAELDAATRFLFVDDAPPSPLWYRVPGLYRPTAYGIEYRTFGSSIANDHDRLRTLMAVAEDFMHQHFIEGRKEVFV